MLEQNWPCSSWLDSIESLILLLLRPLCCPADCTNVQHSKRKFSKPLKQSVLVSLWLSLRNFLRFLPILSFPPDTNGRFLRLLNGLLGRNLLLISFFKFGWNCRLLLRLLLGLKLLLERNVVIIFRDFRMLKAQKCLNSSAQVTNAQTSRFLVLSQPVISPSCTRACRCAWRMLWSEAISASIVNCQTINALRVWLSWTTPKQFRWPFGADRQCNLPCRCVRASTCADFCINFRTAPSCPSFLRRRFLSGGLQFIESPLHPHSRDELSTTQRTWLVISPLTWCPAPWCIHKLNHCFCASKVPLGSAR